MSRLQRNRLPQFTYVVCSFAMTVFFLVWTGIIHAEQTQYGVNPAKPFTHELWDEVLQAYVDQHGFIDFPRLKAYPRHLNRYLDLLENASPLTHPARFPSWQHELAYWLNARNALILRYTLNQYPTDQAMLTPSGLYAQFRIERLGGRYLPTEAIDEKILSYASKTLSPIKLALTTLRFNSTPLPLEAYTPDRVEPQVFELEGQLSAMEKLQKMPRDTCHTWFLKDAQRRVQMMNADTRRSLYFPPKAMSAIDLRFPDETPKPVLEFCAQFNPNAKTSSLPVPLPPPYLLMDLWQIYAE